jgi:hypothetical protein
MGRIEQAAAAGARARLAATSPGLLAPVSCTPLTAEEVFAHFQAVGEACALRLRV